MRLFVCLFIFSQFLIAPTASNSLEAAVVEWIGGGTDNWTHPGGDFDDWEEPAANLATQNGYFGTTSLDNGIDVTFTADSDAVNGTNPHDSGLFLDHLSILEEGNAELLITAQRSAQATTATNANLTNYFRMDIELSEEALVSFYLHDIDAQTGDWGDAVYVEAYTGGFGEAGEGIVASFGQTGDDVNLTQVLDVDGDSIVAYTGTTPNFTTETVINESDELTDHSVQIDFGPTTVQYISIYYWNIDTTATGTFDQQYIGLGAFRAARVPEPSTWAMLLLTVCGALCVQFRQRRRANHAQVVSAE